MDWELIKDIVFRITAYDNSCADDIMDLFYDEIKSGQIETEINVKNNRISIFLKDGKITNSVESKLRGFCKDYEEKHAIF